MIRIAWADGSSSQSLPVPPLSGGSHVTASCGADAFYVRRVGYKKQRSWSAAILWMDHLTFDRTERDTSRESTKCTRSIQLPGKKSSRTVTENMGQTFSACRY